MTTNLIDGNALGHAFHRATKLTVGDLETQAIFGMLKGIQGITAMDPASTNLLLWDGRADFRFAILPEYKASREAKELADPAEKATKDAYRRQVPLIKKMFSLLGVRQMTCANLEADDLAGYFSQRLSKAGQHVRLITGDSDWWQLVNERVEWIDIRGEGKKVNHANFFEMTGYMSPDEYIEGKAMVGDSTDDIPPCGGLGAKGAQEFMAQFGSVAEFRRRVEAGEFVPKLKKHKEFYSGEPYKRWQTNMQMMDLRTPKTPDPAQCTVDPGAYNEDVFKQFCERLVFRSILRDFDNFVRPFRQSWATRQLPAAA